MIYSFCIVLTIASLILSLLIAKPLICLLRSISVKQIIRKSGPASHVSLKSDTPTIGGLIFLIPLIVLSLGILFFNKELFTKDILVVISVTFVMALMGFSDDYLKVRKKQNKGISGWTKLFIQFVVALVIYFLYKENNNLFYLFWIYFVFAGATNSYNLTDGLDGLLAGVSLSGFFGFFVLLALLGKIELLPFISIFFGGLLGFLYFNKYPAKVFMGDTGSMAIGGAVGSLAIVTHTELFLIGFATIPIIEAVSVILQVISCQISKRFFGKDIRIFKMTPLHHHFELTGWKETDIVKRFFVFQGMCVIAGIILIRSGGLLQ